MSGRLPDVVYPLRALAQDEVFASAFAVIRHAPRAVLGLPFIIGMLSFVLTMALTVLSPGGMQRMFTDPFAFEDPELTMATVTEGGLVAGAFLLSAVSTLLWVVALALLALPTLRAGYGLPTTVGQTLRLRASRIGWLLLHIVVMAVILGVAGFVAVLVAALLTLFTFGVGLLVVLPGLYLLLCWVTASFMFAPVAIVVERRNAFSAIGRSFALNRGNRWRNIGAVALLYLMLAVAMLVASAPVFGLLGVSPEDPSTAVTVMLVLAQFYDAVISALLVSLLGCVISLMYLNCRFRQEGLDVVLLQARDRQQHGENSSKLIPGSPEHVSDFYAADRGNHAHS